MFHLLTLLYAMFSLPASTSGPGEINWLDVLKVLRMAGVAAVGVFCAEVAANMSSVDFGAFRPLVDIGAMLLTELVRRYFTPHQA